MNWNFPWPLFVLLGTGLNLARTQFMRANQIEEEKTRLERKQAKRARQLEELRDYRRAEKDEEP